MGPEKRKGAITGTSRCKDMSSRTWVSDRDPTKTGSRSSRAQQYWVYCCSGSSMLVEIAVTVEVMSTVWSNGSTTSACILAVLHNEEALKGVSDRHSFSYISDCVADPLQCNARPALSIFLWTQRELDSKVMIILKCGEGKAFIVRRKCKKRKELWT